MKFINVLFLFFQVCLGYVIKGFLDEGVLPLSPEELSSTSVQLLSDSQMGELPFQETGVRADDGYFVFSNVTKGDYLLVFNSIFLANKDETYKVSVREKVTVNKVFDGHDYRKDLGPLVEYPIVIGPLHKQKYFKARESFALFQLVKNPMMLLSIASLGMVFFLPKLTESGKYSVVEITGIRSNIQSFLL